MKTFTVSQINRIIKDLIDNEIVLEDIVVTGELSSFSITRNIAYFTLKDGDNLLSGVQFGAKQDFKIGDMVRCRGNIKYYPKGGKLSLNVLDIQMCGQGELYQKFLTLKQKLEKEGLFSQENKIPIPKFVTSIGVVTSKTGAVLQDIKNVSLRRNPNLDIYVYDVQVQGNHAVRQIIDGITYFDNYSDVDVIIVARGGGSVEDLSPFNDEELARIAYICNKPIISAVGHETDFTIIDFVSDLRASTPSVAAELVSFVAKDVSNHVVDLKINFDNKINNLLNDYNSRIKLNLLNVENKITDIINDEILNVLDKKTKMDLLIDKKLVDSKYRVDISLNTLDKLNPINILRKGYSKLNTQKEIEIGDKVEIITATTTYKAEILDKEKNDVGTRFEKIRTGF